MDHVAIDLGGRESQICRRSADGKIVEELRVKTNKLGQYLARLEPSRVIVETCAESYKVAIQARDLGHDIRIVPATLAPQLGVGARGLKTDQRDARALSEASCRVELRSVHIPSVSSRERRSLLVMRNTAVASRTALANSITGYLRGQVLQHTLRARPRSLPEAVRELYRREESALPAFVERQLLVIEVLTKTINESDRELAALVKNDPECRRLATAPGVGPVTAVLFAAAVDDHKRFSKTRDVGSYIGLTPGERSSSDTVRRLGITKAGNRMLRWALVQAAWSARVHAKEDPLVQWANQLALRRGTFIATVALARRLSVVLLAMMRDGTDYRPRSREASRMAA